MEGTDEPLELEKLLFFFFLAYCYKALDGIENQPYWTILPHFLEMVFQGHFEKVGPVS